MAQSVDRSAASAWRGPGGVQVRNLAVDYPVLQAFWLGVVWVFFLCVFFCVFFEYLLVLQAFWLGGFWSG